MEKKGLKNCIKVHGNRDYSIFEYGEPKSVVEALETTYPGTTENSIKSRRDTLL